MATLTKEAEVDLVPLLCTAVLTRSIDSQVIAKGIL